MKNVILLILTILNIFTIIAQKKSKEEKKDSIFQSVKFEINKKVEDSIKYNSINKLKIGIENVFLDSTNNEGYTKLSLLTEGSLKSSTDNEQLDNTGIGKLGVSFSKKFFYGSILFNVINRNKELVALDSSEIKVFSNNLLIPDNSGNGISNFNVTLGLKSFSKYNEKEWLDMPLIHWKRFGVHGFWQINNTRWTKDSISTQVYISSVGVFLTYNIISVDLFGEKKGKANIIWFGGFENRILGGDYSLEKNKKYRELFLGTDELKFHSFPTAGFELNIWNFYGRIKETYFGDGGIEGFSGWQATISVGVNFEFNLSGKSSSP